ncbi:hypothetical protein ACELLULO517_27625 [Acidisoma cellulosilytica]|uniref:Uncharacterized protein n=1 Tax=Acidisoma cellulosilyticum TaxID=2802395 RepID=A0A963Z7P0_9PROT|nr:hypothetical protein [Acidisoma cellulosilyticum]MCB8884036.1 hypothetical protein [Acidisoma cellulosilyticum]
MIKGKQDKVSHLIAAMHEISASGHSALYLWMRQNHDRIAEGLDGLRPSWRALATRLGEMKIHDGTGKAPTPDGARGTWYRVRRDLAAARARQAKNRREPASLLPGEIAAGVVAAVPTSSANPSPGEPGSREADTSPPPRRALDIRPARPRGEVSAPLPAVPSTTSSSAAPAGAAPAPSQEPASAQLRRVLDAMATGTTPMPRIVPSKPKP